MQGRTSRLSSCFVIRSSDATTASSEIEALSLVAAHTTIPVPRVWHSWHDEHGLNFITNYLEGETLQRAWKNMSSAQRLVVMNQLADYVQQLRSISQPSPTPYPLATLSTQHPVSCHGWIGASLGHKFCDFCLSKTDVPFGVFAGQQEFYDARIERFITTFEDHAETLTRLAVVRQKMRIRGELPVIFTHGDINRRHVLVRVRGPEPEDVEVTALLDWEQAGWRPIYWESWKWLFETPHIPEWSDFGLREIGNGYDDGVQLELELQDISGHVPL